MIAKNITETQKYAMEHPGSYCLDVHADGIGSGTFTELFDNSSKIKHTCIDNIDDTMKWLTFNKVHIDDDCISSFLTFTVIMAREIPTYNYTTEE